MKYNVRTVASPLCCPPARSFHSRKHWLMKVPWMSEMQHLRSSAFDFQFWWPLDSLIALFLSLFQLTGKATSLKVNNYMELASSTTVHNNFIVNSVCCFGCREYCKSEYQSDWLTRRHDLKRKKKRTLRSTATTAYKTEPSRHSSPPPPFYVLNVNKRDASPTQPRRPAKSAGQHSLSFGKYYFLNSKKTKFKNRRRRQVTSPIIRSSQDKKDD